MICEMDFLKFLYELGPWEKILGIFLLSIWLALAFLFQNSVVGKENLIYYGGNLLLEWFSYWIYWLVSKFTQLIQGKLRRLRHRAIVQLIQGKPRRLRHRAVAVFRYHANKYWGHYFHLLLVPCPCVLWLLCSSVCPQPVWSLSSPNLNSWQRHLTALAFVLISCFSCVWLFATLWTIIRQAPLSIGFSRQEYWSGLPCPRPGDLPDPGIKPMSLTSPALAGGFFTIRATWGTPLYCPHLLSFPGRS